MDPRFKDRRDAVVAGNLNDYEGPLPTPQSPNRQIPDDIWARLQAAGAKAVDRLGEMVDKTTFDRLSDKDKIALLKVTLEAAYRQQDVNKHLHIHAPAGNEPANPSGNALTDLAGSARRSLPEFSRRRLPNSNPANVTIDHQPSDREPAEHPSNLRD